MSEALLDSILSSDLKAFANNVLKCTSNETIKLRTVEQSYAIDTRIVTARARDRAFGSSIGVFIAHERAGSRV